MNITLVDNLPFISIQIAYQNRSIEIPNVLIDTGSATTIVSADIVSKINILPEANDIIHTIRGVGGRETVFSRQVDQVKFGGVICRDCSIEIGGMDYGFDINGIVGMDLLMISGVNIDLKNLKIKFSG